MTDDVFTPADRAELRRRGIAEAEACRQIQLLTSPPPPVRLARPAVVGDGIQRLAPTDEARLLSLWEEAAHAGRLSRFVPASGAASRMFQSLLAVSCDDGARGVEADVRARAAAGEKAARDVARFFDELDALALAGELRAFSGVAELLSRGDWAGILRLALGDGLGYAALPKGLLPFHRYADGVRTAFEEHLFESADTLRAGGGTCRLHFTIAEGFEDRFAALLAHARGSLRDRLGVELDVGFSTQSPSTDTLALGADGRPFRNADGSLLFRPGGHGALLANLERSDGDVVFLKNIDNVLHQSRSGVATRWKRLLAGALLDVETLTRDAWRAASDPASPASTLDAGLELLATRLGDPSARSLLGEADASKRGHLLSRLARPLRVCGMVKNQGEPGGGPFWVREPDGGETLQIVESSQLDLEPPDQRAAFEAATHFNPVDLVVSLRGPDGRAHRLEDFVDPATVFLSRKSKDGKELIAIERPGLWNGAMARWNTVFVEVPVETFAPVKSILDLLRPEHQPA